MSSGVRNSRFSGKLDHVVVGSLELRNLCRNLDDKSPAAFLDDAYVGFIRDELLGRRGASGLFAGSRLTMNFGHTLMNTSLVVPVERTHVTPRPADLDSNGLELPYQVADLNTKSVRDDLERLNGYVALPALYFPNMRAIQTGAIGEDILRPPAFRSKLAH